MRTTNPDTVGRGPRGRRPATRAGAVAVVVLGLLALGTTAVSPSAGAAGATPAWTARAALVPANADSGAMSFLTSTDCPAPGNCVAVGYYETGGSIVGFANVQSGGAWTTAVLPLPPDADPTSAVAPVTLACGAVGSCVAGGTYKDTGGNAQAFVSSLASGTWTTAKAVLPVDAKANPVPKLVASSCSGPGICAAVGYYVDASGNDQGLLLVDQSGTWTTTRAPVPADAGPTPSPNLTGVACGGPQACVAVGSYTDTAGNDAPLVLTLSGGTWTAARAPVPADAGTGADSLLYGASCPTATACTLVGAYGDAADNPRPLAVSDSAGVLTPTAVPAPADAKTTGTSPSPVQILTAVSCPTVAWCAASGVYAAQTGTSESPMLSTLSGGSWTTERAPGSFDPASSTILLGVSCSWPGSCAAAGFTAGTSTSTGILETLAGGTWTESAAVLPTGAVLPAVSAFGGEMEVNASAVSCVAGTCAAAGAYRDSTPVTRGFLDLHPSLSGYQFVAADGGIFNFGAPFLGSMGGASLNKPIVGIAGVPDTGGYYEVASDGGIFNFGAPFQGSMGGQHLNQPIVGIAFDSTTGGYYEVASDGGIFNFGAPFLGSMGGQHLNQPIVGIAFDPNSGGYYEVASDGGIFNFGAPFQGSTGGIHLNRPVVGLAAT